MHTSPLRRSVALTAALALSMAACGQSDGDASTPERSTTSTAAPAASRPAPTVASPEDDGHDHGAAAPRLLVADGESATLTVIDLATEEALATLDLPGAARLHGSDRHVFAVSRDEGRVEIVDGGAWQEAHGDHHHAETTDPAVTEHGFDAAEPTHLTDHGDLTALFNDGDGSVVVLDRTKLGTDDATLTTLETGVGHHGVAVALAELDVVLTSTPVAGEQLPVGVTLWGLGSGDELQRFDGCPGLHGEVATDHLVAFGCSDGVLLVEHHEDEWVAHKVDRPAGSGPEDRTGTLVASPDGTALIGNLGREALVRVDTETKAVSRLALPAPMASFTVDAAGNLLVVTTDGQVQHLDPETGEVLGSVSAVDAFTLPEGHGGDPVPQLVAAGDHVYLTDPAGGNVVELAVDDELAVTRTLEIGGTPASVTVVGLPTP